MDRDHPRVGGEKLRDPAFFGCWLGSPPRGRGKVRHIHLAAALIGITPAWAGKRSLPEARTSCREDHPRVGGEKFFRRTAMRSIWGSPPRGRGKVPGWPRKQGNPRITPAWAGKRLKRSHRSGIFISGPIPFHSVLHRPAGSGGSRAGRDGSPAGQPQNTGPA